MRQSSVHGEGVSGGPGLGIDLGTTNSVVAVADGGQARVLTDEEGRRLLPSVVSFHPNGETLLGYEARVTSTDGRRVGQIHFRKLVPVTAGDAAEDV